MKLKKEVRLNDGKFYDVILDISKTVDRYTCQITSPFYSNPCYSVTNTIYKQNLDCFDPVEKMKVCIMAYNNILDLKKKFKEKVDEWDGKY